MLRILAAGPARSGHQLRPIIADPARARRGRSYPLESDDGISANGTFVNGERPSGRRRLSGDEIILIGTTSLTYHAMEDGDDSLTHIPTLDGPAIELSPMQKRVLVELCRPYKDRGIHSVIPATNRSIADELCVSVDAVKLHLRALFQRFAIADLPQNEKRVRLVELAFERRAVSDGDLA